MAKTIEINNLQEPTPATKKQKWNKESKILMEYHNYKGDHTHRYPLHATNKIMLSEAEVEDKALNDISTTLLALFCQEATNTLAKAGAL